MISARTLLVILLFSLFSFLFSLTPVRAQTPNYPQRDTHFYVQRVMLDVMAALSCNITGVDPSGPDPVSGEPKRCLGYDPANGKLGFVETNGGAIGAMGTFVAVLYQPPISTSEYLSYMGQNFGLAKPVYAQGIGFEGLRPVLGVWTVFRNLVYILFAAAFIIVGFAIMLRVHIDPRTVMTIQNQIPKLIIALILVTFSYAIAGFFIDFMYVSIYLLFSIILGIPTVPTDTVNKIKDVQQTFQGDNPLAVFNNLIEFTKLVTWSAGGVKGIVHGLLTGEIFPPDPKSVPVVTGVWNVLTQGPSSAIGWLFGWIAGFLALLIIAVAILWALFRLWFQLIMAYILFLLDVVFAPFWILGGIFPGSPIGFGAWLRSMLSNLSPFPVTIAMFLLAKIFMDGFQNQPGAFVPPLIGNPGDASEALAAFIGLGFILLTPQVVTMMKDFLKSPQFKYAPAVGQALGVGPGFVGSVAETVTSPFGGLATTKKLVQGIGLLAQRKVGGPGGALDVFTGGVAGPKEQKSP